MIDILRGFLEEKGMYKRYVKAKKDSELFAKVECLQNELN